MQQKEKPTKKKTKKKGDLGSSKKKRTKKKKTTNIKNTKSTKNEKSVKAGGFEEGGFSGVMKLNKRPKKNRITTQQAQYEAELKKVQSKIGHNIEKEHLNLITCLSDSTGFGDVWVADCLGSKVAVKIFKGELVHEKLINEITIQRSSAANNVVQYFGTCVAPEEKFCAIIMELMDGDLQTLLFSNKKEEQSLYKRIKFALDAAIGLNWLHSREPAILHMDIKLANLMYKRTADYPDKVVKIGDFGLSLVRRREESMEGDGRGTLLTMAPEVMTGEHFDTKADVYSFAIVLWQIISLEADPFPTLDNESYKKAILSGVRPDIPSCCSPLFTELLKRCWHPRPEKRPSFAVIMEVLEQCLIEIAIPTPSAASFWWDSGFEFAIKWEVFVGAYLAEFKLPTIDYAIDMIRTSVEPEKKKAYEDYMVSLQCMNAILVNHEPGTVKLDKEINIEWFGYVSQWFAFNKDFHYKIWRTLDNDWFYGNIGSNAGVNLVFGKKKGAFIVRFSMNKPGAFCVVVSVDENRAPSQYRVARTTRKDYEGPVWFLEADPTKEFSSIRRLVQHLQQLYPSWHAPPGHTYFYEYTQYKPVATTSMPYAPIFDFDELSQIGSSKSGGKPLPF